MSFNYNVTSRSTGPLVLNGTASDPSINLQNLTCSLAGNDHTIKKSATTDKITVTTGEFNALSAMSIPGSITIHGADDGNGNFTESSVSVNAGLARTSEIRELAPQKATGTGDS